MALAKAQAAPAFLATVAQVGTVASRRQNFALSGAHALIEAHCIDALIFPFQKNFISKSTDNRILE